MMLPCLGFRSEEDGVLMTLGRQKYSIQSEALSGGGLAVRHAFIKCPVSREIELDTPPGPHPDRESIRRT